MKHFAKTRQPVQAAQWTGEMTPDIQALIGDRKATPIEKQGLALGNGWFVAVGDWILSTSGEDIKPIGDEMFRRLYEEVDPAGRPLPETDAEFEESCAAFVNKLDAILVSALKLSAEAHPGIWRDRNNLLYLLRHLIDDQRHVAKQREHARIRDKIAKDL